MKCERIVPALDIFRQTRRFEMPVKMAYARAFADSDLPALLRAEQAYLEMIRVANDYFEYWPRKTSPDDYVMAFRNLVASVKANGFDPQYTLRIDVHGETANGQHRVATAAALGLDVPVCDDPEHTGGRLTYIRFRERGLPRKVANFAIAQYMRFNDCARVVPARSGVPKDAIVWYRGKGVAIISFPHGVPADFPQTLEEARRIAERKFPDRGLPNWRLRARLMRLLEPWRKLMKLRYRMLVRIRKGKRRAKARFHVFELTRRQWGYEAIADFVARQPVETVAIRRQGRTAAPPA